MNKNDIQIRTHAETIPGTPLIQSYPGSVPSTPIIWPALSHTRNQIQQTKGSAKTQTTNVLPTTQPNASAVAPRTTPAPVSRLRVVSKAGVGSKTFTVKFTHPSNDPYFSSANVYLKKAGGQPTLVASGKQSPLSFTAPTSNAPHAVFVTSVGNWGETDILKSPSHPVRLH